MLTREHDDDQHRERLIRAWLIRHYDEPDPPHAATWYVAELLDMVVRLRLAQQGAMKESDRC
jgi:hypothetical protein